VAEGPREAESAAVGRKTPLKGKSDGGAGAPAGGAAGGEKSHDAKEPAKKGGPRKTVKHDSGGGGAKKAWGKLGRLGSNASNSPAAGGGGGGEEHYDGITRTQVEGLIHKAVSEITDQVTLDNKNQDADKLVFETKLRRTMQDLVAPVVE
jgi:hypothetical protein